MSEFLNVEKPFLEKLQQIGWNVIIHKNQAIPEDPSISLRSSFKEVTLESVFKDSINRINPWLNSNQIDEVYSEIRSNEGSVTSLLEANTDVFEKLINKSKVTVAENEQTGERDAVVKLIDFSDYSNNTFTAINQFRVLTPGTVRQSIIPDIVLFVNGLPLIVIECKDVDVSDPISESVNQIQRYSNCRDSLFDDDDDKEGSEDLFQYNLFNIATHGEEARFGTITGDYEYYLNWKDIFPEKYQQEDIYSLVAEEEVRYSANGLHKEPEVRQEVLIQGMLNHEILLDVLQHFTVYKTSESGSTAKIVCRYQQYRAVGRIIERLRSGDTGAERSGVVWHTQGSGKSLTMIFLIRKLRSQPDLKDYKVLITVDRVDLEKQLSRDAVLTGEFKEKNIVSARKQVKEKLRGRESSLNMVMIHKFVVEELRLSKALKKAYEQSSQIPVFKPFEIINESDRILILIDEAHRTQAGDMGANLFAAFPNSAKIAFTGTPLLTERHKQKTHERFGGHKDFIDTYKIREAVKDRATLDLIYIGKTSKDRIKAKEAMDGAFEDQFQERTKEERELIQQKYGTMQAYLENKNRIIKISNDLVEHYLHDVFPNGFKAMVVANSVLAAVRYEYYIAKAIERKIVEEEEKAEPDFEWLKKVKMLNQCAVVTKQDNNEAKEVSRSRQKAKELKAVDSFKEDFNFTITENGEYEAPHTGVGIICVCDMLLTGFDAPVAQVMYLDKNLREHDLLQAIARVNRTKTNKGHGLLVDYFGVSNHLRDALNIWGCEEEDDIKELLNYFKDMDSEIPVLEARYNRVIQLFEDKGIEKFSSFTEQSGLVVEYEINLVEDCIELAESIPFRAQFDTYLKAFFDSLDLLFSSRVAHKYYIPSKRLGYLLMRIRNRYRDPSMDLKWAKPKVRKLIDAYLKSEGIDSTIAPVSLYSKEFNKGVKKLGKNSKAKASEMEHAIRRHIKVNIDKDPGLYKRFLKRMEEILGRYKDNWVEQVDALADLKDEMDEGREGFKVDGLDVQQSPFYDLIIIHVYEDVPLDDKQLEGLKSLVIEIVELLQDALDKPNYWNRTSDIKRLRGELLDKLDFCDFDEVSSKCEKLTIEILSLAKKRHEELTGI